MKRIHGSILFLLLCLVPSWLYAGAPYAWSVTQSSGDAVQHEAIFVEYTCRFDSEAYEYIIVFNPPEETDAYRMVVEGTREQIIGEKRVNTYRFIVFPKKAGALKLAFDASMERTTKASIENNVIGRDNVKKLDYTAQKAVLPSVDIAVSAQETPYAGQMKLSVAVDKTETDAYAPVQVRIRLEGYGNLDAVGAFTLDIPKVKQFTDGPEKNLRLGKNGYAGSLEQQFAIVSENNFTVPALQLRYYDTVQGRSVTLTSKPQAVTVRAPTLQEDSALPKTQKSETTWPAGTWLQIVLALIAGIAIGRFLLPVTAEERGDTPLSKQIMRCSDPRKFAAYLAMLDADKYRELIDEIEQKMKRGEKADLKRYKSMFSRKS